MLVSSVFTEPLPILQRQILAIHQEIIGEWFCFSKELHQAFTQILWFGSQNHLIALLFDKNLAAVEALSEKFGNLDLIFVESGGDNLSATFSPELADLTIYVIDVAEGEKIPRKGGPGITKSDFLVINKTDLAPYVGASLEVMERDTNRMRGERPWTFTNLKAGDGLATIIAFLEERGMLRA